jgi:hypothetical protein
MKGVGMLMCLRVCVRGRMRGGKGELVTTTDLQEVRVARGEDQVVRDEAEVAGHNRLPRRLRPACARAARSSRGAS